MDLVDITTGKPRYVYFDFLLVIFYVFLSYDFSFRFCSCNAEMLPHGATLTDEVEAAAQAAQRDGGKRCDDGERVVMIPNE